MAAYGWRKDSDVTDWLLAEGHRFNFFQAVRLLQMARPDAVPVGEGIEPQREAVRFSARANLSFPASDVAAISAPKDSSAPAVMEVNLPGLAGSSGPLPTPFTELMLEREWQSDVSLRDFLDIFNHRLLSLLYRVRKTHRVGFDFKTPETDLFAAHLFSLLGLGTEGLREQMHGLERALLIYTGLLIQRPRSLAGLEIFLAGYFNVPVSGRQLCGQWHELAAEQLTSIGVSGRNQFLGSDAVVLGSRVWEQQGSIELQLGPLSFTEFSDFLPTGSAFKSLCELTGFYAEGAFDCSFRLKLNAAEIPVLRLADDHAPRLGWTSWLVTAGCETDDEQVLLTPQSAVRPHLS